MALIDTRDIEILQDALQTLADGFKTLPEHSAGTDLDAVAAVLQQTAGRMQDNYPYQHPLYAGQMLKPPHPVARLAYAMSMWINPNNHALDGGRASTAMEKECVRAIADMFNFEEALGHLCGGGTMANLEALWVAGRLHPGKDIVASSQAHYTHGRISEVLALNCYLIDVDRRGRMDIERLEAAARLGNVGTVVATLGTTGLGAVDPLPAILDLRDEYGFRVHVDAAYGGYFCIAGELDDETKNAFDRIPEADSVVVDPHKHGLQPYGCGCVLFSDPAVGTLYKHDSPYTYFSSEELHLGEISLECSRAGSSAVALWATQKLLPLARGGEFARGLDKSLLAARELYRRLESSDDYQALLPPELDIVVFGVVAESASTASERAQTVFDRAAAKDLHLALIDLPVSMLAECWPGLEADQETVTCLRSVLMKPEHLDWIDAIWTILEVGVGPAQATEIQ